MAGDWIKLHRKLLENPIMSHDGLCRLWVYCLMRANWKSKRWMIPGTLQPIEIPRGSFVTGRESLFGEMYPKRDHEGNSIRREWTPTSRTVWRWLTALEGMECVKLETVSNRCTLVTVCNYNTYQSLDDDSCPADVPPVSSSCPADVPPVSTTKESKNSKEGKEQLSGDDETIPIELPPEELPAEQIPIPEPLAVPNFRTAWGHWITYRRKRRLSVREQTMRGQLEHLAPHGPETAIECLRQSIRNGWAGIFPEKIKHGSNGNHSGRVRQTNTGTPAGTAGRGDI